MHAAKDETGRPEAVDPGDDEIDLESGDTAEKADTTPASLLRSRLAVVAGFLSLFHLVFAVAKWTGPTAGTAASTDAPTWSLLLRAAVAAAIFAFLRSRVRLGRRQLRVVEACLFGFEILVLLAAQNLSAVDLIDRRDLVDAVAIQKNGVMRALVLMLLSGIFVPRSPAATARIAVTFAAAMILCQGLVLHHADTVNLDRDDLANHQIVMVNALFLIVGVALSTLAAWVLRGRSAGGDGFERVGPYRLLRKLDEGGMGEVYLAEHEFLDRPCALKIIRSGDPDAVARFEREVQAAATLSHPNTITIFDSGRADDGTPYCAMEYLPGRSVAAIVRDAGPMPAARAVHLARQVCGALAEAHHCGFVHRDLSPANIFVSVLGGRCDVAKVLDFGVVGQVTADGQPPITDAVVSGTPEYLAPEQAVAGRGSDARADVYGLGTLLYFLVTGVPPFVRATPAEVLRAHLNDPVKPPRELVADVPADLEAVILRCLAKRPEDRYADARAVADALEKCGCATEWTEPRAEAWWLEQASAQSARSTVAPPARS
ncbi:MAG: serine/threonine-protein kinase [Planctomycetia bacterium]